MLVSIARWSNDGARACGYIYMYIEVRSRAPLGHVGADGSVDEYYLRPSEGPIWV